MRLRIFSARDAAKNFGAVLEAADADPVTIHRHGRPRAAVIGWPLFEQYRKAYEDALEEKRIYFLEASIKALAEGKLGTGQRALALAKRLRDGEAILGDAPPTEQKQPG